MQVAVVREVSPSICDCELTHLERVPIDYETARQQHAEYLIALREAGLEVRVLPAEAGLPDAVFVEDPAIVLDECAVITRPGADSRKPETETIAPVLAPYRQLHRIQPPGTLDGGDVLRLGKTLHVGLTPRTNAEGVEQLRALLQPYGYTVRTAGVRNCLHLKTAITQVSEDTLLINPDMVNESDFPGWKFIRVDPSEPLAGNALLVGEVLIYPAGYPRTRTRLEAAGISPVLVPADELAKAEGGVTCCSLIFNTETIQQNH